MREKKVNRLLDSLQILEDKNAPSPKEQKYASLEKKGKNQKKKKKTENKKRKWKSICHKVVCIKKGETTIIFQLKEKCLIRGLKFFFTS